jgi:hypothetical protein
MELDALKEILRTEKLHPVHVDSSPLDDDRAGHTFVGSLQEYFEAVRAIGTPVVLIFTKTLEEQLFRYTPDEEDEYPGGQAEQIDLSSINPELRAYKVHIGKIGIYKLAAAMTNGTLNYFVSEQWWLDFLKHYESASDQIDDNKADTEARSRAEQQAKDRNAIGALGALIADSDFVGLPTQKAMIAYAVEKIPELETVDELVLRAEVQNLSAKIKAKGLGRKR